MHTFAALDLHLPVHFHFVGEASSQNSSLSQMKRASPHFIANPSLARFLNCHDCHAWLPNVLLDRNCFNKRYILNETSANRLLILAIGRLPSQASRACQVGESGWLDVFTPIGACQNRWVDEAFFGPTDR